MAISTAQTMRGMLWQVCNDWILIQKERKTGLTGFSKENNLVENILDRLAIQNLLPNLGGISNDVALFTNNLRNESILTIRNTEFTQYVITLANINNDFKTRSNVFTNGDKVDAYYNDIKQNDFP